VDAAGQQELPGLHPAARLGFLAGVEARAILRRAEGGPPTKQSNETKMTHKKKSGATPKKWKYYQAHCFICRSNVCKHFRLNTDYEIQNER